MKIRDKHLDLSVVVVGVGVLAAVIHAWMTTDLVWWGALFFLFVGLLCLGKVDSIRTICPKCRRGMIAFYKEDPENPRSRFDPFALFGAIVVCGIAVWFNMVNEMYWGLVALAGLAAIGRLRKVATQCPGCGYRFVGREVKRPVRVNIRPWRIFTGEDDDDGGMPRRPF